MFINILIINRLKHFHYHRPHQQQLGKGFIKSLVKALQKVQVIFCKHYAININTLCLSIFLWQQTNNFHHHHHHLQQQHQEYLMHFHYNRDGKGLIFSECTNAHCNVLYLVRKSIPKEAFYKSIMHKQRELTSLSNWSAESALWCKSFQYH